MKKLLLQIFFITMFIFGLNGCYTIIWSPDSEFPNQDNSEAGAAYYGDYYYGDYYYFYDIPWWYDFIPPVAAGTGNSGNSNRDNNSEIGTLRDTGGRSDPLRVPDVQPPSRDQNSSGNNKDNNSSSSNNTSSNNSDRGSSSSSNSGSSGSSGSGVRDNNGGRSSGGRK